MIREKKQHDVSLTIFKTTQYNTIIPELISKYRFIVNGFTFSKRAM